VSVLVPALEGLIAVGSSAAVLIRAAKRREDRVAWMLLGLALAACVIGGLVMSAMVGPDGAVKGPSVVDAILLPYFVLVFASGVLLARAHLPRLGPTLWLDGTIGLLGAAAIVAQLMSGPVREVTGDGLPLLVGLAYPMGNVLTLMLVVVAFSVRGWRVGAGWTVLGAAFTIRAAGDALAVFTPDDSSIMSGWIAVLGIVSMGLTGVAAWCPAPGPLEVRARAGSRLLAPALFAFVAAGLLVLDHFLQAGDTPVYLSAATLLVAGVRVALTFRENQTLQETRQLAITDELTGLANRRLFYDRLNQAVQDEERLAVAMVDLDRFKDLNDTLGHHAGDLLLANLGPRLIEAVGEGGLVARLGGDEFALLLPGAGLARASEVGRHVGAALQHPFEIDGLEVVMDASIGAALYPQHGEDAEGLLQRADVAMYQAKQARTGFQAYDPGRDRHSRERLTLMAELRRALERDELILHYQPKVELESGRVAGVEALVRWQHPIHGLRGPGAFLPHAEHTALMKPLTLHVLRTALSDLARWRSEGLDLTVAVNLAVQSLLDLRTPAQVGELLVEFGLQPSALILEVTESLLLHDPARAGEVLRDLQEMGCGLALDDFGTGYSSLEHLKRLPVHELKIDKSFVMAMDRDRADRAIVESTAGLGRALGLRVVAEGVESAASAALLAAIGCDLAQGFHYSPPVPAEQLPALVRSTIGVANLAAERIARRISSSAAS
jgi:diguanylate cyclase (GGDEF)-like protein